MGEGCHDPYPSPNFLHRIFRTALSRKAATGEGAITSAGISLRPGLIKALGVGGESAAGLHVEIEHVAAAVELELRAVGRPQIRDVIDDIPADAIRRHQI